jgi:uracil-DNA glycosylase
MTALMERSWNQRLQDEFQKPYMRELEQFLGEERARGAVIYPPFEKVFTALCYPFEEVKVVIMGQDPYHGEGQAHGLSFSVPEGVPQPPSLVNIFKEIRADLGVETPKGGCLEGWAKQGVLLLNATLTVRANEAKSHYGRGWERFTDRIVQEIVRREDPVVFLLWGKSAKEKFDAAGGGGRHLVLVAPHPSPLSAYAGFFGCKHFSKANEFLISKGKRPIDWGLSSVL